MTENKEQKITKAQYEGAITNFNLQIDKLGKEKLLRQKLFNYKKEHNNLTEGRDKPDYFYNQEFWDITLEVEDLGMEAYYKKVDDAIKMAKQQKEFAEKRLKESEDEKVVE